MAKKQSDQTQPGDMPEIAPHAGGSYIRNDDGSLTQTEGAGVVAESASLQNSLQSPTAGNNQE